MTNPKTTWRVGLTIALLAGVVLAGVGALNVRLRPYWVAKYHGERASLHDAALPSAPLAGAILCNTDLSGAALSRANLSGADLQDANLSQANLGRANLTQ